MFLKALLSVALFAVSRLSFAAGPECPRERAPVSEWVTALTHQAAYVFFGTVTTVSPPAPDSGESYDISTVKVHENYKGKFIDGQLKPNLTGWGVLPGESAVFFVDKSGRILPCSSYQHYLSDYGVIAEVRKALASGT